MLLAVKNHLTTFATDKDSIQLLVDWYYGKNDDLKDIELDTGFRGFISYFINKKSDIIVTNQNGRQWCLFTDISISQPKFNKQFLRTKHKKILVILWNWKN